jgi:hypothetical protein
MAFTARSKKIVKERGAEPDEFEESVAQVRQRRGGERGGRSSGPLAPGGKEDAVHGQHNSSRSL